MRAKLWVPAAAGLLLVVGVLGARGSSAVDEADLLPAPPAAVAPSPAASAADVEVLLVADGVEGMQLGSSGADLARPDFWVSPSDGTGTDGAAADPPGGCTLAWPAVHEEGRTWSSQAWIVDDEVSAVVITRDDPASLQPPGLDTWLGPTLGSSIGAAGELPRAKTRTEAPFGTDGPQVTVVVVPVDGVEVVYSDAVFALDDVAEQARGRVTTIEVRHPRARACSGEMFDDIAPVAVGEAAPGLVVGRDGLTDAPIGSDEAVLHALPGAQSQGGGVCEAFLLPVDGGTIRAVTVSGVTAMASVEGEVADEVYGDLPFRVGMTSEEVSASTPPEAGQPVEAGDEMVEVTLGERVVRADLQPLWRWVDDVEVPVSGGPPVVHRVSVRNAAVNQAQVSC